MVYEIGNDYVSIGTIKTAGDFIKNSHLQQKKQDSRPAFYFVETQHC